MSPDIKILPAFPVVSLIEKKKKVFLSVPRYELDQVSHLPTKAFCLLDEGLALLSFHAFHGLVIFEE